MKKMLRRPAEAFARSTKVFALLSLFGAAAVPVSAATCESLRTVVLENGTVTAAELVAPGAFTQPDAGRRGGANAFKDLPSFCRVALTLTPSSDSDIKAEVWLPANGWNRKLQVVGNGGWAGVISYAAMADALRAGYATASTDTGHVGGRGTFALDHPEKLIDFSWRSEHETTVKAKQVVQAFYGAAQKYAYWNGCSTGGRQGLKEAQMFPNDYDGIIAGAPANRTAISLWVANAVLKDPASYIPPEKYPVIHEAAVAACDAADGLKDGLIDDPRQCRFDPAVLTCKGADPSTGSGQADCLTAPQVAAAKMIYSPAINPRTHEVLFSSFVPGTELGWAIQARGPEPAANIYDQFKYVVFKDEKWDWKTFDFDKDAARGNRPENVPMNATNPDMSKFFAHGGKLLLYHGWSDNQVPTLNTITYFESVVKKAGGPAKAGVSVRLFLAPGMGHCGGGEGPSVFDKVTPLEQWVERGRAPEVMIASHVTAGKVDRTRPLCPYPQVAKYKGTGSIDEAANFVCAAKEHRPSAK
ncbi:MAG TPA: tannase/feruloyl esterase family alpha/beta hydrolase [Vicinamibacterales bacterium]|nr:tannase/feruloyl esterase family alpha/beta hydrolase [Vicinamibacterales bacterium]